MFGNQKTGKIKIFILGGSFMKVKTCVAFSQLTGEKEMKEASVLRNFAINESGKVLFIKEEDFDIDSPRKLSFDLKSSEDLVLEIQFMGKDGLPKVKVLRIKGNMSHFVEMYIEEHSTQEITLIIRSNKNVPVELSLENVSVD